MLDGRAPSIERVAQICDVLGFEFYAGPRLSGEGDGSPTDEPSLPQSPPNAIASLVADELASLRADLRADIREIGAAVTDPEGLGVRAVQTFEVEAAAGDGAFVLDESPVAGPVWFRRDWIAQQGIDPVQAVVISVRGDSMEPTLPAGCKILVDRRRRKRRNKHVFVFNVPEGLVVKRLRREDDGAWILASDSDSPDWPDVPWPAGAEIVGEVRWMSRDVP